MNLTKWLTDISRRSIKNERIVFLVFNFGVYPVNVHNKAVYYLKSSSFL